MKMRTPDGKSTIEVPECDPSKPGEEFERAAVCFFLESNALSLESQGSAEAVLVAHYLGLLLPRIRRGEHIARVWAAQAHSARRTSGNADD